MKNKVQALMIKLKLDKHHRIERFGVLFFSLFFMMITLVCISFVKHVQNQKIEVTDRALYTEKASWSLTGQPVTVVNVYRNTDCTKAFILLQMDVSRLSVDANDYQMLMTGYQGEPIQNKNAVGAIYVFGNTGYMGLYFADSSGFKKQIYDIVVRNTQVITSDKAEETGEYSDKSFSNKNQIRIYANLAGKDAPIVDFLDEENPELIDVYADVVSVNEEGKVREELNNELVEMNNQMSIINEQAEFLQKMNIVVPSLPQSIANDYITDDASLTANNPKQFDKSMYDETDDKISSTYENISIDTATNGDSPYVDSDKLYLVTDFVFPGGYQYNYQDMKLTDYYVTKNILPEGMKFKKFESEKRNEASAYSYYTNEINNKYSKWYIVEEDGKTERWTYTPGYADDEAIQQAITRYIDAVTVLYNTKKKFQTESLANLARIEASAETTVNMFSINTNTDGNSSVLIIYE